MVAISAEKTNAIQAIFSRSKAVIGVIHCDPFPGSPKYRGKSVSDIVERALRDAENYISGGVHGLIIENHGDIPFSKPEDIGHETSALMAVITEKVRERFAVPLGINVLANAAIPAMAIALAGGADFVRVNQWANAYIANEGFIEGAAAKTLRYRSMLRAEHIRVFADSHVKHGSHAIVADRSIQELTRDVDFFEADAVIATGQRTGDSATMAEIDEIRAATELPLLVGSGVTPANVKQILGRTQGVIVASTMKVDGVWWNDVEAVVGQTMTTLAHEINQPLNALSMYLFTAGRAIEQGQAEQARTTLSKAEGLINRIDAIIRSLRQFTRRAELETPLHPVDLRQTFTVAWELLAMRHKPQQGMLVIPDDTVWIQGDEVRVHQVLVNVLSNALDACPHAAQITVSWQIQAGRLCVLIADNGPGWPAALLPSLLKPFTTSKTVGLGIGLSICVSLMTQMEGALRLASTFTRSACVVLEFNLTDVKDGE